MTPVLRSQNEFHKIHRGKELEERLSLALSTIQVTVRISSAKFPEVMIDGDTTYLHLHNLDMDQKNKRYKIIHLKEEGYSVCQIAAKVPCGISTAVRTLNRFSKTNFIADKRRSGHTRSRKTSLREDRLFLSNRKLNSSQILKQRTLTSNVCVGPRTVRGRLLEIGLRGCKARQKPLLTEFQRKRRLTWAREHSSWTIKDWGKR
ncbi:hypothetical protein TNCV_371041 [Trichonephila clavipes]|nr:hypothetical protein TNCV_371041 [Trichonephila clavipes]